LAYEINYLPSQPTKTLLTRGHPSTFPTLGRKTANIKYVKQESAADAVKPARRESMQKLVPFVVETSYSLKKT